MVASLRERAEAYVMNLERVLAQLPDLPASDRARRYASDARYYLLKGDLITSIVCSSYAEGVLDAMKDARLASFDWNKAEEQATVAVAGTWDLLHPGHVKLLEVASALGKLIVIVARDSNVLKAKGHAPVLSEDQRLDMVASLKPVYKAVLGRKDEDPVATVAEINPDYFVLGPDQPYSEQDLEEKLRSYGAKTHVLKVPEKFSAPGFMTSSSDIVRRCASLASSWKKRGD